MTDDGVLRERVKEHKTVTTMNRLWGLAHKEPYRTKLGELLAEAIYHGHRIRLVYEGKHVVHVVVWNPEFCDGELEL